MDNSAKIKKNYKLMGTESDPVIIAQRLLNLYRQLHIFSPEKKEAYNQMLLEQPPEIKRMLASLPGGIVVQEYISDLEAEAGITVEHFDSAAEPQGDETVRDYAQTPPASVKSTGNPEMIKGIVEAFKEAIETSAKNRKEDTKELAQTIVALQSKLAQSAGGGVVPGVSAGTSADNLPRLEEIISGISKAQGELIKEMAQAQTQELSQLISSVLKEIQQMSTQTLVDAVQTVHRENMDFFKNQIFSSVSMVPMSTKMAESKTQFEYEKNKNEHVSIDDLPDGEPISLDAVEEPVSEGDDDGEYVEDVEADKPAAETEQNDGGNDNAVVSAESSEDDYEWEYVEDNGTENETLSETGNEQVSLDDFLNEEPVSLNPEKEIVKGVVSSEPVEQEQTVEPEQNNDDDYEWEYEETAAEENGEAEQLSSDEIQETVESGQTSLDDFLNEEPISLNPEEEIVKEVVSSEPVEPEQNGDDDYEWEYEEAEETANDETEALPSEESSENDDDYEWEYVENDETETPADDTGECVYADDDTAAATDYVYADDGAAVETDDGDYEWEYVEDDGSGDDAAAVVEENVVAPETRETDPYNPDFDIKRETADNPLFGHNDNIVFKSDDTSSDGITLDDSFGLSSNDDISVFPR